jgi:hypothetical protein
MPDTIIYFCDESSFHDTYMAVAGLALDQTSIPRIKARLKQINKDTNAVGEVKWQTAKSRRKNTHRAYIDYLFDLIDEGSAHFHIRFAPFNDYDHSLSGRKKRSATVGKMHYQLILHRAVRYYGKENKLIIHPDDGDCTEDLPGFLYALNMDGRTKYKAANCIQSIECRDSKSEAILQLLDVTLGALSAHKNGRHLDPKTSATKRELAEYALSKMKLSSLDQGTPINSAKRNVWNATPKWITAR